jgi:hypothetical protein
VGAAPNVNGWRSDTPVVEDLGIDANFIKVKSVPEIMAYDIMSTPALVVNEQVLCYGRIPNHDEIKGWLEALI